MRKILLVVLIVFLAFVFRLILSPLVFHADLLSQASWGEYVANKGPMDLYSHNVWTFSWPNHPPLVSLYYGWCFDIFRELSLRFHQSVLVLNKFGLFDGGYFDFVDSLDKLVSPEVPYPLGFMLSLKLLPILADLLIGLIIYFLAKRNFKYLIVYLFLPFSWYVSALWGQTDQSAFLFALISFLALLKYPFWSVILFFIGVSLKPTSIFLVPIYLFVLYKSKSKYVLVILGIIICLVLNYFIFKAFSDENIYKFTFERLLPRIMDRPPRLTTNSFNFWHIFVLDKGVSSNDLILFIPGKIWGLMLFLITNVVVFIKMKKLDIKSVFVALFVVSFGGWLFLTDMLDRYAFAGIVSGLIVTIYYPKVFKYWLILSLVYWLNLFRGWWYPSELVLAKNFLVWNNYEIGRLLALANVLVYLRMSWLVLAKNFLTRPDDKKY